MKVKVKEETREIQNYTLGGLSITRTAHEGVQ